MAPKIHLFNTASKFFAAISCLVLGRVENSTSNAFAPPSSSLSKLILLNMKGANSWADGKNAAPAIMCEVENVPILEPVPEGFKRLFMVRHGEVINPGGDRPVYYGAMDVPLSPLGELEAIEAGSYLSNFHLQHVASSPLSRAKFGARQVLARQCPPEEGSNDSNDIQIFEGFKELDRGSWCGKTKDEIGTDMLARFDACDPSVTPGDGGESYPALKERVLKARDKLLEITDVGKASAIVSHLQVTRAMLSDALGMDVTEMAGLKIATASVTCVDYCSKTGKQIVRFQSFKPECGLEESEDGAN
mmetsp:Transcript_20998/g.42343  ORF Transcript_20998/g.42343 Transcript_20998/m.42343 type:complete len:304 (-) Transcript_20998:181-1092(-)